MSAVAQRDLWLGAALAAAFAAIAAAAVLAIDHDTVLAYADTASHVIIPRRVFDNRDNGLAQLGVHWTPLLQILQFPFVMINPLYRSGVSGTLVSGGASLVTSFFVYRLAILVGAQRSVAFVSVLMLIAAPSFLYVSVIPMVYALVMATTTGSVYFLTKWAMTGSGGALLGAGLMLLLATLAHFDTWILIPVELATIALIAWLKRYGHTRIEASLLLWGLAGVYGVAVFLFMNLVIFGDALNFLQAFPRSSSATFVSGITDVVSRPGGGGGGEAGGTWSHTLRQLSFYPRAVAVLAGLPLAIGGAVGGILYAWRWRKDAARLVPLLLFYPLLFYSLWVALRGSIIVPADQPEGWTNLRYGNTIFPALAFFLAVGIRWWIPRLLAGAAVVAIAFVSIGDGNVAAWREAKAEVGASPALRDAAHWLGSHSGNRTILFPVHHFLMDRFELYSDLPSRSFVDSNDTKQWRRSHRDADRVDPGWIVWLGYEGAPSIRRAFRQVGFVQRCYLDKSAGIWMRIYAVVGSNGAQARSWSKPGRICPSFGGGPSGDVKSARQLIRRAQRNKRLDRGRAHPDRAQATGGRVR